MSALTAGWLGAAVLLLLAYEARRAAFVRRGGRWPFSRRLCWWSSVVLLAATVIAPVLAGGSRLLWVETLQFALLGFGVAPLAVLGAPGSLVTPAPSRLRLLRPRLGVLALLGFLSVTVAWRLPVLVDAVARDRPLLVVEAMTLVAGTWWLWVAVLGSPRWPGLEPRPLRIVLAMAATWSVWIFAYAVGFSGRSFYPAYGAGNGAVSEQEWSVILLWGASAAALTPGIFVNLLRWLRAEQLVADADSALRRRSSAHLLAGQAFRQPPGGGEKGGRP